MLYGFLNCFWGYALKVEAARLSSPKSSPYTGGSLYQYGQSVGLADFNKKETQAW